METLVKKKYLEELVFQRDIKLSDNGPDVTLTKEWLRITDFVERQFNTRHLTYHHFFDVTTHFVVKRIQKYLGLEVNGLVDKTIWDYLVEPMKNTYELDANSKDDIHKLVSYYASKHLQNRACQMKRDKRYTFVCLVGPWVRSYMDGNDGDDFLWAQPFVCTVLDQAFSTKQKKFTDMYENSFNCEDFRKRAQKENLLIYNEDLLATKYIPKIGDIYLKIDDSNIASHSGIIYDILDKKKGLYRTIEGNVSLIGDRRGYLVSLLSRNLLQSNIQIVQLQE